MSFLSSTFDPAVLGTGLLAAGAFAWLLAAVSGRLGWIDPLPGGECARKLQRAPVPVVGGLAVALGGSVALALVAPAGLRALLPLAPALLCAFAVGFWDDRVPGGLPPLSKLAGQALAGVFLAIPLASGVAQWTFAEGALAGLPRPALALAILAAAVLAQNAWNTFDNADGTLTTVSILALFAPAPAVAGALIGFLPFNLSRRPSARPVAVPGGVAAPRLPHVYLGDAGSHWLAILIVATPPAWPALFLPLLDLVRVAWVRIRAGDRPWVGDRRHLAHRLAERGLGPREVAVVVCLLAAPATILGAAAILGGGALLLPLGLTLTALLFTAATRWTADPCPQASGDG